jgi:hypothetical protein
MIKSPAFAFVIGLLVCCTKDDTRFLSEKALINSRFTHDIPGCTNPGQNEINCTEFVEFIDGSTANALLGGGDIVIQMNYELRDDHITLNGYHRQLLFKIHDERTLFETSANEVWQKN